MKNPLVGALSKSDSLDECNILDGPNINPPDCPILENWVFKKSFFDIFVLVINNLCEKLVSSLELWIKLHERFKITSVSFFIAYFSWLSCELDNFTFEGFYWVI